MLDWAVARAVTFSISAGSAKDCPARAALRKRRHQPSCRFHQAAPTGMKTWRIRGWSSSQVRVEMLWWEGKVPVTTTISPPGITSSTACRNYW